MRNVIYCLLICFILVSCKALPGTNYEKLMKNRAKSKNIYEILKSEKYILLPLNIEHTNTLKVTDPIILLKDSVFSNYKMFKSFGEVGKKYKITLYSLCDCLGIRKFILNPLIAVVDTDGKWVETKLVKKEVKMPDQYSSMPFHADLEWEYILPKSGDYRIIVLSKYTKESPSTTHSLINVSTNIVGDFMITVQEN